MISHRFKGYTVKHLLVFPVDVDICEKNFKISPPPKVAGEFTTRQSPRAFSQVPEIFLLPSRARPKVSSSAYSKSPPTGRPLAIRVTCIPSGSIIFAKYIAVASPSILGLIGGAIILLSSIAAIRGNAFIGAYGMTKAAESALARNLAVEYGPSNIRVNAIAPGLVKTDFAKALWEDPVYRKKQESVTPLRRIGLPEDIAGVAHFLASPASAYLTGQSLVVDGGETITSL